MRISFHSINDSNEKVFFETEAYFDNNIIRFKDKSYENTEILIEATTSFVRLKRVGNVNMDMLFKLGNKTVSKYKNDVGLSFEFSVLCTNLLVTDNKILVEYDMLMDDNLLSKHKIWILIH